MSFVGLVKFCVCPFPFGIARGMLGVIILVPDRCRSIYCTLNHLNIFCICTRYLFVEAPVCLTLNKQACYAEKKDHTVLITPLSPETLNLVVSERIYFKIFHPS